MTNNEKAFLDMIAVSEIGWPLLKKSDNGYNVLVGSTPTKPLLFSDYSKHPRIRFKPLNSDAAGRYQLMGRYFEHYARLLKLPDFSPASQDAIALQQIREFGGLPLINAGKFPEAINRCRKLWASFPGAGYGQNEHHPDYLLAIYKGAGGTVA